MALAECQQPNGYLGAYPDSYLRPAEEGSTSYADHVWAPFYTYHKILGRPPRHVCALWQ